MRGPSAARSPAAVALLLWCSFATLARCAEPQGPWQAVGAMGRSPTGCGIDAGGQAWYFQADTVGSNDSTPVAGAETWRWSQLAAGGEGFDCGVRKNSSGYCWGTNTALGQTNVSAPPTDLSPSGGGWRQVSVNGLTACGLRTVNVTAADGSNTSTTTMLCLGSNSSWLLGPGGASARRRALLAGQEASSTVVPLPEPTDGPNGASLAWVAAYVGEGVACGLAGNGSSPGGGGRLFCWGQGGAGNDSYLATPSATPVQVSADVWQRFALCGVLANGTASCLTRGGEVVSVPAPATSSGRRLRAFSTWENAAASPQFGCGIATGGAGFCWGFSARTGRPCAPVSISPRADGTALYWRDVQVGVNGACGLAEDGNLYCFEPGSSVGSDGCLDSTSAPVMVQTGPGNATAGAPSAATATSSGSSTPVGAIVGGVVGGIAALVALAAALLVSRRRGWLCWRGGQQPKAVAPSSSKLGQGGGSADPSAVAEEGKSPKDPSHLAVEDTLLASSQSTEAWQPSITSSARTNTAGSARAAPVGPLSMGSMGSAGSVPGTPQLHPRASQSQGGLGSARSGSGSASGTASAQAAASMGAIWQGAVGSGAAWAWASEQVRMSAAATAPANVNVAMLGQLAAAGSGGSAGGAAGLGTASSGGSSGRQGSRPSLGELDVRHWEARFEDLELIQAIGQGAFGQVHLARWQHALVAVKLLLPPEATSVEQLRQLAEAAEEIHPVLRKEAGLLARLRHPCIVQFLAVLTTPLPGIITEYCSLGSVCDLLRGGRSDAARAAQLTWPVRLQLALDAAMGMSYLHSCSPPIIHKDLKTPNILVVEGARWHAKITDFGLSRESLGTFGGLGDGEGSGSTSSAVAGNPRWLAPELLNGARTSFASDVYAFGCVLYELLTWTVPWAEESTFPIVAHVLGGRRPSFPADPSLLPGPGSGAWRGLPSYLALMDRCWAQEPKERPSFAELVPLIKDLMDSAQRELGGEAQGGGARAT